MYIILNAMDYSDISYIIITNRPVIKTIESIPTGCEIIISDKLKRGEAHNDGINQASKEWIAIMDDDITFDTTFLDFVISLLNKDRIIGLEGYYPSPFVIARFMIFHKSAFDKNGDFETRNHGFETEWCIRAIENGYSIVRIPREGVIHTKHSKDKPATGEGSNIIWLLRKHPMYPMFILKTVISKIQKSSLDEEYEPK